MAMDTSLAPTSASERKINMIRSEKRTKILSLDMRSADTTDEIPNESVLEGGGYLQELCFKNSFYGGPHVLLLGLHFVHASLSCRTRVVTSYLQTCDSPETRQRHAPSSSNCWMNNSSLFRRISRLRISLVWVKLPTLTRLPDISVSVRVFPHQTRHYYWVLSQAPVEPSNQWGVSWAHRKWRVSGR